MAKVGILSMQRIINYGSFLQAYALKQLIQELGHDVEFVDYHVDAPLISEDSAPKTDILGKISKGIEALKYNAPFAHRIQFIQYKRSFAKRYHPVLGLTESPNYTPELDYLVIGSDEVFNCVQRNPNVGYSLELFGKNNHAKSTITYAASFGNTTIEKLNRFGKTQEIGSLLNDLDAVSVRDANSGGIVEELTGKTPEYHLDPVLAYDYMRECNRIPQFSPREKYLIVYAYSGRISKNEADWIYRYARKKNLKVYTIGGVQPCADRFIDCSPFEVLTYFQNAEEIITDTFHGSIFSIITKRPFVTLVRKSVGDSYGNEEKLTDLFNRIGLRDRAVYSVDHVENTMRNPIDYEVVASTIQFARRQTREYLSRNLTSSNE